MGAGVLGAEHYSAGKGASNGGCSRWLPIVERGTAALAVIEGLKSVRWIERPLDRSSLPPSLVVSSIVRAKYAGRCDEARRTASVRASAEFGVRLSLGAWGHRAASAVARWPRAERAYPWDWDEIHRRYRNEPDRFDLCMWVEDLLCGVALTTLSGPAATIAFLEGQPGDGCPLKGLRAAIAIEAAQRYAQLNGRTELRVQPISEGLEHLYRDIFGFELATPNGEQAYYRRRIP